LTFATFFFFFRVCSHRFFFLPLCFSGFFSLLFLALSWSLLLVPPLRELLCPRLFWGFPFLVFFFVFPWAYLTPPSALIPLRARPPPLPLAATQHDSFPPLHSFHAFRGHTPLSFSPLTFAPSPPPSGHPPAAGSALLISRVVPPFLPHVAFFPPAFLLSPYCHPRLFPLVNF